MSNLKHDVYIQISYKLLYMSHLPMNSHTGLVIFTINYTLYILHPTQGIWSWTRTKTVDKVSDRDVTSINAAVFTKNDHYLFANWFWKIARVTRSNKVNIILIIQPPSPSSWFRLCCHQTYSRFPSCYFARCANTFNRIAFISSTPERYITISNILLRTLCGRSLMFPRHNAGCRLRNDIYCCNFLVTSQ